MFNGFFDTSAIDAFTAQVVDELKRTLPAAQLDAVGKPADKRREQARERTHRLAAQLVAAKTLNIYQKAKLGVRLEGALTGAGYPAGFSKAFAYEVVQQVALASASGR